MIFGCLQLKFENKIDFERQFLKKSVLAGILLGCWDFAGILAGILLVFISQHPSTNGTPDTITHGIPHIAVTYRTSTAGS